MNANNLELTIKEYANAVNRLEEALKQNIETNPIVIDGTIQRFEFCFELSWKVLKKFLMLEKVETKFPKDVLRKAYQYKLIHDEQLWLNMVDDRNLTVHTYKEDLALQIYERVKDYYIAFRDLEKTLKTIKS